ncbi:protein BatD [Marinobacter sp. M1N3S26]|uniref:protein BatD n=1 Tax=unclassified Marinobacter TaxID=83889 RepID=UPI00387B698E
MVIASHRSWRFLLVLLALLPLQALAQQPREEAYIELSASADEVYAQQELRLTVKLYYTNQVIQGQLTDPEHPDAVIEKLGEQKQYRERVDGESYRVVERNYVIFPQKPGRLQLPPLDFQGTARHSRGHHYRISDSAVLFPVNVKDVPAEFSGGTWLPATDLSISDRGLERTGPVTPGDNLTRTLTLTARGLPATTLPSLDIRYPDALRSYPEPEQRESSATADGVLGELQQTVALVPVSAEGGDITLPEVRIPWWDVNEDRERVAVLPARTIELAATPGFGQETRDGPAEPVSEEATPPQSAPESAPLTGHWFWPLLVALLALGWATTVAAWWLHHRRRQAAPVVTPVVEQGEKERFRELCDQAREQDSRFFNGLPAWVSALAGRDCHTSDAALAILSDPQLSALVNRWRESLFRDGGGEMPDGQALVSALKAARTNWQNRPSSRSHGTRQVLPDLYPDGLNP